MRESFTARKTKAARRARRKSKSPPCRTKRDKGGATSTVETALASPPQTEPLPQSPYGKGFGLPAIRHDHIRNEVVVRSMPGSVVL